VSSRTWAGVIDPTKVASTALQNAASIAGFHLTTKPRLSSIPSPGLRLRSGSTTARRAVTRTASHGEIAVVQPCLPLALSFGLRAAFAALLDQKASQFLLVDFPFLVNGAVSFLDGSRFKVCSRLFQNQVEQPLHFQL
jgi:hypothetical protein